MPKTKPAPNAHQLALISQLKRENDMIELRQALRNETPADELLAEWNVTLDQWKQCVRAALVQMTKERNNRYQNELRARRKDNGLNELRGLIVTEAEAEALRTFLKEMRDAA